MRNNIIHNIAVWMAVLLLSTLAACSKHDDPAPPEAQTTGMYLCIAPVGQTRSSVTGLPDNEKMRTVRVVILHEDGSVEHNVHYPLTSLEYEIKYVYLKVRSNEHKKIFIFANEESVSSVEGVTLPEGKTTLTLSEFLSSYATGSTGFETAVNDLYFAPVYTADTAIPMSSTYEFDMGEGTVEKTFHVVRVAAKFTINFQNWRGETVNIEDLTLEHHADKNFLMARVGSYPQSDRYATWIDWLKAVSDASSENDDISVADAAGWLKDYSLPSTAVNTKVYSHGAVTVNPGIVDVDNLTDKDKTRPGAATVTPVFYLPESKKLKAGIASDGDQEYTLKLKLEGRDEAFVCPLPNLKSLFRNTHVLLNIRMYNSLQIEVDVIPYSSVTLDPIFGLTPP